MCCYAAIRLQSHVATVAVFVKIIAGRKGGCDETANAMLLKKKMNARVSTRPFHLSCIACGAPLPSYNILTGKSLNTGEKIYVLPATSTNQSRIFSYRETEAGAVFYAGSLLWSFRLAGSSFKGPSLVQNFQNATIIN